MNDNIAVIGTGMMGGAIIKSLLKGGYRGKITAVDIQAEKLKEYSALGVNTSGDNKKSAAAADIIFIIVKPGDVEKVLKAINLEIKGKLLISVAATVPLAFLRKHALDAKIVRIMPNLGAMVQAAYTAYCCTENVTGQDKEKVKTLLNMMGACDEVDEKYMDAITAVSGSGPGYLSIIIEAMTYAGLKVGLPRNIALKCAAQTVMGTGKLVIDLDEEPSKIKDMTTTPGGTTIEAIYQIEQSQIRPAMIRAIEEATKKSQAIREKLNRNRPNMYQAVIFDWDGTLADTRRVIVLSFQKTLSEANLKVSNDYIERRIGIGAAETFREILRSSNMQVDEALVKRLVERKSQLEIELTSQVKLFPGAKDLLEALQGKVHVGLASMNNRSVIMHMVKANNLTKHFEAILTAESISNSKPHPEIFLKTAEQLKTNPQHCVILEDSIFGVKAAKTGGMSCIAVTTGVYNRMELEREEADLVVDSLADEQVLCFILG